MTGPRLGKEAILDAAARLFDEEGVDAVSLSRINQASGHRNKSATSYHIGSKEDVVRAVVDRSMGPLDDLRNEMLDDLEQEHGLARPSVRAVIEVALGPLSGALDHPDGRRHLRLLGQLIGHPRYVAGAHETMRATRGLTRCSLHLAGRLDGLPPELRIERVALLTTFAVRAFADQARLVDAEVPARSPLPTPVFTRHLVDLLTVSFEMPPPPRLV